MPSAKAWLRAIAARAPWISDLRYGADDLLIKSLRKPAEPEYQALSAFHADPGEMFLDVGANRGHTVLSARLYNGAAEMHAFEPNPALASILARRLAGDRNLTIHNVGLGAEPGGFTLFVPFYRGHMFDGLASFDREEAAGWLNNERLAGFDPRFQEVKEFSCTIATLDSFALAPAFIKIDVQGHEAKVIEGGAATLARHQPVVFMEHNQPERDAAWLLANGWNAYHWREGRLHPAVGYALNILYVPERRRASFDASVFA
jgi:FkbM family methyltransferase